MNKPLLVRITSIAALQPKGRHLVADELVSEGSSRKDESRFLIKVIQKNDVVQLHCFLKELRAENLLIRGTPNT